ncbi:unnamed protein product [Vicia faba]|uniref:Uncharacterized protein n=1 Tax=Vicia faba TaxID=3906 RepID=A0AAV0YTU6_VICFA|nr:unnamed protein product [Vicia faba]
MSSFTHATTLLHAHIKTKHKITSSNNLNNNNNNNLSSSKQNATNRRNLISTFLSTSMVVGVSIGTTPLALAQNWGTRSFLREHFFEPGLSPEDADLKNAMTTLPENRRKEYVKVANELVDYLTEMDRHVRSPKVYESYLYYEKTLKSIDELVAMLV